MEAACLGLALTSASIGRAFGVEQPAECGSLATVDSLFGCGEEANSDALSCGEPLFGCITPLAGKTLTGDWFGARPHLADSGATIDANVAQFYMGAVSGGLDSSARYAGHGDCVMNIDGDKALGMKGMFITLRAEHRFGPSLGGVTGALLPSAVATELSNPESEQIYLTNVRFTQMFSETFGVFAGTLDTLDGDQNAFASGRGMTQFSNMAFVGTPIGLRTTPYSTCFCANNEPALRMATGTIGGNTCHASRRILSWFTAVVRFLSVDVFWQLQYRVNHVRAEDPLPSWNDGAAKRSIITFVEKVTKSASPDFVPVPERIAVFDNDGTLWCEQPIPVQFYFALDRIKALAPQHPEWKDKEPFSSLLKGNLKVALAGGEHAPMEIVTATHCGMMTVEFEQIVRGWIATAKHPTTGRRFVDMIYQPMLEVLA